MNQPYVLLIDDDAWQCDIYQHALAGQGFVARAVQTLNDAIALIDAEPPLVIIADMLLAGETIFTLLNELQSDTELGAIPVVIASNLAQQYQPSQLAAYGVVRVLDKATLTPTDVVAAVRAAV